MGRLSLSQIQLSGQPYRNFIERIHSPFLLVCLLQLTKAVQIISNSKRLRSTSARRTHDDTGPDHMVRFGKFIPQQRTKIKRTNLLKVRVDIIDEWTPTTHNQNVLTVTKNIILTGQRRRELISSFRDLLQVRKQLYALHTLFEIINNERSSVGVG